jgi:histidinol-phosphate aminotransferase
MGNNIISLLNPRILDLPEYDQKHITICWQKDGLIERLMSNESSYEPLPCVQKALQKYIAKANWYPEDVNYALSLRQKLANYVGLNAENITLGNGSTELLDLLFQTFLKNPGQDEIILPAPDYAAYPIRAKFFGYNVQKVICGENVDHFADYLLERVTPDTALILFSRPNNPMGKVVSREDVIKILKTGIMTVVDEAYVELADEGTSVVALVPQYNNLIVLRTYSKGFGLAGIRLGYLASNPEVVKYVNRVRHIFNVNLLALAAGEAIVDNLDEARININAIRETRDWMVNALNQISGLIAIPSQANFIMVDVSTSQIEASVYVNHLFENGFSVRNFSKTYGLEPNRYFRITVGKREAMEKLVECLRIYEVNQRTYSK